MKVALVYRGRYQVREALDLETLSSVLRSGGHQVNLVYDPDTFGVTDNVLQIGPLARLVGGHARAVHRILELDPDVLIFSVLPSTYRWCREIAASVKARGGGPVVFLGLHPSLVPEHVMAHGRVDYAIAGEAEGVVNPLLDAILHGGDVSGVGNLWHRHDGRTAFTFRADLVDLDTLPLPDKDLFAPYVSHHYSYSAMVSRGCPYQCSFCEETCSKQLYGGHFFRRKSPDTVMRELIAGKRRYRFREVVFKDSYLSGNKGWLRDLMTRYRSQIGVPFKCFSTIWGFDDETARLLKEGGCYSVEFGLQTWNDRIRREVLGRRETGDDAFRALECCDRHKLRYDVDHMFNLPGETEQDHALGAECYKQLGYLGRVKVHFLTYYPTATIVDHAIAVGDLPPDARARLADGQESDFYDQGNGRTDQKQLVAAYATLYKILPLVPRRMVHWLVRNQRVRWLRWIPSPVTALLQGLDAIRSGDLRFAAYLQTYPRKIFHTLLAASKKSPSPESSP